MISKANLNVEMKDRTGPEGEGSATRPSMIQGKRELGELLAVRHRKWERV